MCILLVCCRELVKKHHVSSKRRWDRSAQCRTVILHKNGAISYNTAETSDQETYVDERERSCTSAVRMELSVVRNFELGTKESR